MSYGQETAAPNMNQTNRECLSDGLIQHAKDSNDRLQKSVVRLNQLSVRLLGPRPASPKGEAGAPTPMTPTLEMKWNGLNQHYSTLLSELEDAINSIEKFI